MVFFIICDVVDEVNVDLIVMGCWGLGFIIEGVVESVIVRVINFFFCLVLVVFQGQGKIFMVEISDFGNGDWFD